MKTQILVTVSVMALMMMAPAIAQTYPADKNTSSSSASVSTGEVSTDQVRAAILDDYTTPDKTSYLTIDKKMTANGMLGESVYNAKGDKIASVDDIVIDQSGMASMVVLSDGGVFGIGDKLAAFDYNMVTRRDANGDIIMPLTEEIIDKVSTFSYDPDDAGKEATKVMPASSYKLSEVLDANLLDPSGNKVADVENVSMRDGMIDYLLVGLNQTLGMGGTQTAIKYRALTRDMAQQDFNYRLSPEQNAKLQNFVKTNLSSR